MKRGQTMYKFQFDYGYSEATDSIRNQNSGGQWTGLNTGSVWYQSGFNFSFIGGQTAKKGRGLESGTITALDHIAGGNGGQLNVGTNSNLNIQTWTGETSNYYCPGDFNDDGIGIAGEQPVRSNEFQCPDDPDKQCGCIGSGTKEIKGDLMNSPRVYLIHDRISISSEHYAPNYKQCGEHFSNEDRDFEPYKHKFYHELGANPDDPNAYYYEAQVAARRLIAANGLVGGNQCGLYDVSACDVPSGQRDHQHDNPYITLKSQEDVTIFVYTEPLPPYIRRAKLPTSSFFNKYMNETENPETAQTDRICMTVDSNLRPILNRYNFIVTPEDTETVKTNYYDPCPLGQSSDRIPFSYVPRDPYRVVVGAAANTGLTPAEFDWIGTSPGIGGVKNQLVRQKVDKYFNPRWGDDYSYANGGNETSCYMGSFSYEPYVSSSLEKWPTFVPSSRYIPNEKGLSDLNYDIRDSIWGADMSAYFGDSGSAVCLAGKQNEVTGERDVLFVGVINTAAGRPVYWASSQGQAAIEAICDEYEMQYPDYADENYDFSNETTPVASRPSLGYKIYKSWTSKDGPFVDITKKIAPQDPAHIIPGITIIPEEYPCIDPAVPCYTPSEQFIDSEVEPGVDYWYYTTSLESVGDNNYIESDASNVIEINVPEDINEQQDIFTDDRKLHIKREVAVEGKEKGQPSDTVPVEGVSTCLPPFLGVKTVVAVGYRLGNNTNSIPFFGFSDPLTPPILTDGSVDRPCMWYQVENASGEGGGIDSEAYGNCTIDAGDSWSENCNDENLRSRRLVMDSTSYQYVMGLPYENENCTSNGECESASKLTISTSLFDSSGFSNWLRSITELNFTRFMTDGDDTKFEPFYHSQIQFVDRGVASKTKTFKMNPARYGNGRNQFSENWNFLSNSLPGNPVTYLGYYSGLYLFDDLFETFGVQPGGSIEDQPIENFIVKDAAVDNTAQNLEYFNMGLTTRKSNPLESIKHLDMSNNGLYMFELFNDTWGPDCCGQLAFGIPNWPNGLPNNPAAGIEHINLSNNKLCTGGQVLEAGWLSDESFPTPMGGAWTNGRYYFPDGFLTFPPSTRYVNVSNNVDLNTEHSVITGHGLQYLDISNTAISSFCPVCPTTDRKSVIHSRSLIDLHIENMGEDFGGGSTEEFGGEVGMDLALPAVKNIYANNTSTKYWRGGVFDVDGTFDPRDRVVGMCMPLSHLEHWENKNNPRLLTLNLGISALDDDGWVDRYAPQVEFGSANGRGNRAPNLITCDVTNNSSLERLYLPGPEDAASKFLAGGSPPFDLQATECTITDGKVDSNGDLIYVDSNWSKKYLERVDAQGCQLGTVEPDGSGGFTKPDMRAFFSQPAFTPDAYPELHVLDVNVRNQTYSGTGEAVTTSLTFVQNLINTWANQNKQLNIDIDVSIP